MREFMSLLASVSIDRAPTDELAVYLEMDFERFVLTFDAVGGWSGRLLEIGANPYFLTTLLFEYSSFEVVATNSFDADAEGLFEQQMRYVRPSGEVIDRSISYHSVNVERHALPFADGSFDVVVFCEVIEHLLTDPLFALKEIHRVLRPGGGIIVSTPNVARADNVVRLAQGLNVYDPYSGYGPYGRHNREYNRHELVSLLQFAGFDVLTHFTADVHDGGVDTHREWLRSIGVSSQRWQDLGQYLFVKASKGAAPCDGYPSELFRSLTPALLRSYERQ
jgi:SAM-dependent methyltransferase